MYSVIEFLHTLTAAELPHLPLLEDFVATKHLHRSLLYVAKFKVLLPYDTPGPGLPVASNTRMQAERVQETSSKSNP